MKDHEGTLPLVPIKRGEGVWLEDFEGNRFIEAALKMSFHYWKNHGKPGETDEDYALRQFGAMEPWLLLFDEPTSALDPEMIGEVLAH